MSELAKLRRSKGFSQRGLAEEAGVSPSSVYEIEVGRRKPNPSTLRKIARALNVEVVDLLEEEERPKATAPPSLAEWLEERCGHAFLARDKADLQAMFDDLGDEERRELGEDINREYNEFCAFPRNSSASERVLMRRTIRDAISEVAVKHQLVLHESGLYPEYSDELRRVFELERVLDAQAEIA